jgi:PEP-CTERM motif-containing protein
MKRQLAALSILLLSAMASQEALAGFVSDYQASSGLFPNQISPPYTLIDTADPEAPALSGGVLTLGTSSNSESMFYTQLEPIVDTSGAFFIEARVRFVSGSSSSTARAPITISFTTAPNVGNALFIGLDRVFFNTAEATAGPSALVDTNGAFHTYRIDYSGAGALTLAYDGVPVLAGTTFTSASFNGAQERIAWGELSILAFGTSEWQFFRHNALAVPEPQTYALLAAGLGLLGFVVRRRLAHRRSTNLAR